MVITNTMIEFLDAKSKSQDSEMKALGEFRDHFRLTDEQTLVVYDAWQRSDYSGHQCRYVENYYPEELAYEPRKINGVRISQGVDGQSQLGRRSRRC